MKQGMVTRRKRQIAGQKKLAALPPMWLVLSLCLSVMAPTGFAQTVSQTEAQKLVAVDGGLQSFTARFRWRPTG